MSGRARLPWVLWPSLVLLFALASGCVRAGFDPKTQPSEGLDSLPEAAPDGLIADLQPDLTPDGTLPKDQDGDKVPDEIDPFPTTKNVVYYFKTADQLVKDGVPSGTWTVSGTSLCQTSYKDAYAVRLKPSFIPAGDYLVDTRFTIQDVDPGLPGTDGPGIGAEFRVTNPSSSPSGYDCHLDSKVHCLVIGRWSPADWKNIANDCNQPATAGTYRMRVEAVGSDLSCHLVSSPISPTKTSDSAFPSGTVGLFTYHTKACFDYLLVIKAP